MIIPFSDICTQQIHRKSLGRESSTVRSIQSCLEGWHILVSEEVAGAELENELEWWNDDGIKKPLRRPFHSNTGLYYGAISLIANICTLEIQT